jgi:hypothetical protein
LHQVRLCFLSQHADALQVGAGAHLRRQSSES